MDSKLRIFSVWIERSLLKSVRHIRFIAGVVMLVRAKRVLHHSSQPPPTATAPVTPAIYYVQLGLFVASISQSCMLIPTNIHICAVILSANIIL